MAFHTAHDALPQRVASTAAASCRALEWNDFSSHPYPALCLCLSMPFFAKPVPTFAGHALGRPRPVHKLRFLNPSRLLQGEAIRPQRRGDAGETHEGIHADGADHCDCGDVPPQARAEIRSAESLNAHPCGAQPKSDLSDLDQLEMR